MDTPEPTLAKTPAPRKTAWLKAHPIIVGIAAWLFVSAPALGYIARLEDPPEKFSAGDEAISESGPLHSVNGTISTGDSDAVADSDTDASHEDEDFALCIESRGETSETYCQDEDGNPVESPDCEMALVIGEDGASHADEPLNPDCVDGYPDTETTVTQCSSYSIDESGSASSSLEEACEDTYAEWEDDFDDEFSDDYEDEWEDEWEDVPASGSFEEYSPSGSFEAEGW